MSAMRIGEDGLLEYNASYGLLICRECQYAIQKSAVESHLLRHKIYRGARQRLLAAIATLNLDEPHQVALPSPGTPAFSNLPVLLGHGCLAPGCQHLTVSTKRMKRHWGQEHALTPIPSVYSRPVKLQTFFRGSKVRYFEVTALSEDNDGGDGSVIEDYDGPGGDSDKDEIEQYAQERGDRGMAGAPPQQQQQQNRPAPHLDTAGSPPRVLVPAEHRADPSPTTDLDLEKLTYFHHFVIIASVSLPSAGTRQDTRNYWQMQAIFRALQRPWLMCGVLAVAAHHLATVESDDAAKLIHRRRKAQYLRGFSAGFGPATDSTMDLDTTASEEGVVKTGKQIDCLLQCAQWALIESALEHESLAPPYQLSSMLATIHGCKVPDAKPLNDKCRGDHDPLLSEHTPYQLHGSAASIGSVQVQAQGPSRSKVPMVLLNSMHMLPGRIAMGLGKPEQERDVLATLSAIDTLVECCTISFAGDGVGPAWEAMVLWLDQAPEYFLQMVRRSHPAALVVLAYWAAVLVRRAERNGCWFLTGTAKILVRETIRQLSANNGRAVLDLVENLAAIV